MVIMVFWNRFFPSQEAALHFITMHPLAVDSDVYQDLAWGLTARSQDLHGVKSVGWNHSCILNKAVFEGGGAPVTWLTMHLCLRSIYSSEMPSLPENCMSIFVWIAAQISMPSWFFDWLLPLNCTHLIETFLILKPILPESILKWLASLIVKRPFKGILSTMAIKICHLGLYVLQVWRYLGVQM